MTYRAILHVPSLDESVQFFDRLFGRPSGSLASVTKAPITPGHSTDHSSFTAIQDVFIESMDPGRYRQTGGVKRWPDVTKPHLKFVGWLVDGMEELYYSLRSNGIRVTDPYNELADINTMPRPLGTPIFHPLPADAGLRYDFYADFVRFPLDPRVQPGWSLPPVTDSDPLGIERCSHYTILTEDRTRALKFIVSILGGTVIHEAYDPLRKVAATYVHLADAVIAYAVPDAGTGTYADWAVAAPDDTFHAITWKVVDLERVAKTLESQGVRIEMRSEDTIITDPTSSFGVPWGFTTALVPGDPRE
jgi:hypothetical protein